MTNVLELASQGDLDATLAWYKEQADRSGFFFSKAVAGYTELTADLHQPVCEWLETTEADKGRGLLMPRKYFKSSMVKGYVLKRIVKKPDIRILFVGENDLVGAKNLADVKWNIQSNKLFQTLYPHIIPPDYGRSWSETAITVPRSRSYDEPTIQTIGIGAKHTGFHYDLIIYDDPIGLVASKSPPEMRRAIDWFKVAPGLLDSQDSEELIVGTRWKHGKADLYGWIMDELPYRFVEGRREGYKWFVRSAIEKGISIFPPQVSVKGKKIGYSLPDLEGMRKRMGTYLFNCMMMNNPTAGENQDFPETWLHTYRISEDRKALILDTGERVELASLIRISIYDPSSGGASADAENAILILGTDRKGRHFVLATWSKNCGFGRAIEQWHVLNDKWKCWRNHFESVGAHKEVADKVKDRTDPCKYCGAGGDGKPPHRKIKPFAIQPPPGLKEDRIRDLLQPAAEEGRVYIGEGMTDLRKQWTEFPHSEFMDLMDCLAYGVSKARKPSGQRDRDADEAASTPVPPKSSPRIHTTVDYGGY